MMLKRPRVKDDKHLAFIRELPCCICGDNTATEAAHIRMSALEYGKRPTGGAEKPSDRWCLPLCSRCHRVQHAMPEPAFWAQWKVNAPVLALSLHASTGDHEMAETILERQRGRT